MNFYDTLRRIYVTLRRVEAGVVHLKSFRLVCQRGTSSLLSAEEWEGVHEISAHIHTHIGWCLLSSVIQPDGHEISAHIYTRVGWGVLGKASVIQPDDHPGRGLWSGHVNY